MGDVKAELRRYLVEGRTAVVWKAEGLSEYGLRRPMTGTGTNVLGVIKHLATMELGYFGEVFGRPSGIPTPWMEPDAEFNADLWAAADESSEWVLDLYRRACAHADSTVEALDLDAVGSVPWWPSGEVTLHRILVHMIGETARHAGHLDVVRELIDGSVGLREPGDNMTGDDQEQWREYREGLERIAREADR
ncbi:DinB family protein [Saccharopolyspora sp. TS4A08]|uniref:DinB family protein n=1 Tax=Saccharopolyspora ipomoeae TaxID=3042027 RepID=A0ABT6PVH0_9PSEU|nr:DinB family protein [Saccharopolyspora sp. TS4A08]MDI2031867.1 DinB family protein [Saccharopolyspora sp. TS4A08]